MFSVKVEYPSAADEERIVMETTQDTLAQVERVLSAAALIDFQHLVRQTPVSRHVGAYITRIVRATRPDAPDALDFIKNWVRWGAGPRAGQYLLLAAKSNALLQGRLNVSSDDVRAYALPVLRHRVLCNFAAASEGRRLGRNRPPPAHDRARTRLRRGRLRQPDATMSSARVFKYLPPRVADQVRGLGIAARRPMQGGIQGLHRSPDFGARWNSPSTAITSRATRPT